MQQPILMYMHVTACKDFCTLLWKCSFVLDDSEKGGGGGLNYRLRNTAKCENILLLDQGTENTFANFLRCMRWNRPEILSENYMLLFKDL